jgi:hypothetical protein
MAITNTTCVYNTVTLIEGQKFVLPKDAEIVFTSDETRLTNSCNTPFPTNSTKCYLFRFPLDGNKYYTTNTPEDRYRLTTIKLDNITIDLSSDNSIWTQSITDSPNPPRLYLVQSIADKIWNFSSGTPLLGLYSFSYQVSDDDRVYLLLHLPDIFKSVEIELISFDSDAGAVISYVKGNEVACDTTFTGEDIEFSTIKGVIS